MEACQVVGPDAGLALPELLSAKAVRADEVDCMSSRSTSVEGDTPTTCCTEAMMSPSDMTKTVQSWQEGFASQIENFVEYAGAEVGAWDPARFEMVGKLQDAERNQGQVFVMRDSENGMSVAVKRVPNSWIRSCHAEFLREHGHESELPWMDIGCMAFLNSYDFPYACRMIGVYRDEDATHIVSELATAGDMFTWCSSPSQGPPGFEREAQVLPLIMQLIDCVTRLHQLSIAHGDLSLENILLSRSAGTKSLRLQVIDFGMSSTKRFRTGPVGKPSYQAPEMHEDAPHDAYLADSFSLGVVLFTLLLKDYPWMSTRPGVCKAFSYFKAFGFRAFIAKRNLRGKPTKVIEHMSEPVIRLLEGLLAVNPEERFVLSDSGWQAGERRSVWQQPLLQHGRGFLVA
mmetsp:Transcript_124123/g.356496  ORF Transcript_124123/g.356496 Transcript_124123/m.356496 type:complete len:401 (-) Transcript_124123:298-1500(-)